MNFIESGNPKMREHGWCVAMPEKSKFWAHNHQKILIYTQKGVTINLKRTEAFLLKNGSVS